MSSVSTQTGTAFYKKVIAENLENSLKTSSLLDHLIKTLSKQNTSWAIVGGAVRVWITNMNARTEDLDMVVSTSTDRLEQIVSDVMDHNPDTELFVTKLGGYRLRSAGFELDLWAADHTVGIGTSKRRNHSSFKAVSRSAALSLDSIVYTSRGVLYERGFFDTLTTGVLSLNRTNVVRSERMATKAIRLCNEYALIPDIHLQSMIQTETGMAYEELVGRIKAFDESFERVGSRLKIESAGMA